ncbi:hypothetical protein [Phenylobacterium soli]|uniref:hypothetical protein n=1 Tax=Phenylobacterium soli TaxID=2170551 RepID=UPI0014040669|nr:hypothetical protein [Phenylobacterium soli]
MEALLIAYGISCVVWLVMVGGMVGRANDDDLRTGLLVTPLSPLLWPVVIGALLFGA